MKDLILSYIPTLLRHLTTSLATIGTLLLTKGLITAPDAVAVNAGGVTLGMALVAIATPLLSRLVITLLGKLKFPTAKASGIALLGMVGTAAALATALPSCSTSVSTLPSGAVVKTTVPDAAFTAALASASSLAAKQAIDAYVATHQPKSASPAAP